MRRSNSFTNVLSIDIGLQLLKLEGSLPLKIGTTLDIFSSAGKTPSVIGVLKSLLEGLSR